MFIRVTHWRTQPDRFDDGVAIFREHIVPELEKEPGFMRVIVTGDPETGAGLTITFWQKDEHARAYEKSGEARRIYDMFSPVQEGDLETRAYHVVYERAF